MYISLNGWEVYKILKEKFVKEEIDSDVDFGLYFKENKIEGNDLSDFNVNITLSENRILIKKSKI